MYELHQNEQYFFNQSTLEHLADFVQYFSRPCCLCVPLLGKTLAERGVTVRILDVDERFASVPGFQSYDIHHPVWIEEEFDLIICDPPFYNVSLSQLFTAIRKLAHFNYHQSLIVSYLKRRSANVLGTFSPFNLVETGYYPGYQTVQDVERNKIEFFSNLDQQYIEHLLTR
ncbi:hypothetical protein QUF58_13720 [Anaerolineales bacterium HSG24]|nr:hypothetical protein [Anaerolineales bacterium HSG24]